MKPTNMDASSSGVKRTDAMKRKFFLSKIPAMIDPMPNFLSRCNKKSRFEFIDEALRIVNSEEIISETPDVTGPLRRKGSSLCERRAIELLKDNSAHLSELLRKSQDDLADSISDDESDLED
ncbi:unnamed protein product [Cylindrotheca closterium]|uniref:Uncharacterized protein n=1 Tax=Cylindrotheca closterium TaxID=2856 RepID=A0AAD2CKA7_9STRA|nr:unnamed protein product [Cylindrotheca closterium]